MTDRTRCLALAAATTLAAAAATARGHSLQLFAERDGPDVRGEAYFSGGGAARGLIVRALAADGSAVGEATTDAAGRFAIRGAPDGPLRIVAETLDGHRAEWPLDAAPAASPPTAPAEAGPDRPATPATRPAAPAPLGRPESVRLRDVIAGIGYIAGLAGLALWWRARRTLRRARRQRE